MCYTGKCPNEGYMGDCTTQGQGCPPDGDEIAEAIEPLPQIQPLSTENI